MISAGIMGGTGARSPGQTGAKNGGQAQPVASAGRRVFFEVTREVDAETLIDTYGERYAIVINDAGLSPEEARRVGLESIRKAYRVFMRDDS